MAEYTLQGAYARCLQMAESHYENFPVASRLLPRNLRLPIAAVYAFARTADDFADEGPARPQERLKRLAEYEWKLEQLARGQTANDPIFIALADVIARYGVPLPLLADLLSAFKQDVSKRRYSDFEEVLDYCRRSADPVGRILLHLHGAASKENLLASDRICSALQLINFYQDLGQDFEENDRIYLPLDEMEHFGVTEAHIRERRSDGAMRGLMAFQFARARQMMLSGAPLPGQLKGRFGLEIAAIVEGGLRVLGKLEAGDRNLFARPRLTRLDGVIIFVRALGRWARPQRR